MRWILLIVLGVLFLPIVNAETTVYAYGPNGLVSKQNSLGVSYYHQDNLGSSSLVTDSDGEGVYSTDYYPFGSSLHEDGREKYTYNSKELDNTGLYYYGARYYDGSVGRFISTDPVSGNIFNPQRLNRYTYTLNNPLKYVDPTGTTEVSLHAAGATSDVALIMGDETQPIRQYFSVRAFRGLGAEVGFDNGFSLSGTVGLPWDYSDDFDEDLYSRDLMFGRDLKVVANGHYDATPTSYHLGGGYTSPVAGDFYGVGVRGLAGGELFTFNQEYEVQLSIDASIGNLWEKSIPLPTMTFNSNGYGAEGVVGVDATYGAPSSWFAFAGPRAGYSHTNIYIDYDGSNLNYNVPENQYNSRALYGVGGGFRTGSFYKDVRFFSDIDYFFTEGGYARGRAGFVSDI